MSGLRKRRHPTRMSAALSAVACGLLLALPSSALAGTVSNDPDSPSFDSNPGETNNVTVAASPGSVTFSDATTAVTTADCTQVNPNTVTCTPPPGSTGFSSYGVFAGDLNDAINANGPLGGSIFGDEGNDSVVGSNENSATPDPATGLALGGNEFLDGGPGTDSVQGRGGDDTGRGGDTAGGSLNDDGDQVDLGPGDDDASVSGADDGVNDSYQGGPGIDFVGASNSSPGPPTTPFDAFSANLATGAFAKTNNTPENDAVAGFEDYDGSPGINAVVGTAGSNVIDTGPSNDSVTPGLGADQLVLREGDDSADTRDGFSDRVQCGAGTDTVAADQFDELTNCERVSVTKARPAGADLVAPKCKITKVKRRYSRKSFFKGVKPRITCSEAARLTVQEYVGVKRSGKLVTTSKVGDLILAEKTVKLGKLVNTVKLKASKRLGKRLPKRFKAKIRVTAQDEFGNRSVVTKRVVVKNKKKSKKKKRRR